MTTQRYTITLSDGTTQVIIPALEVQSGSGALSTARQIQLIGSPPTFFELSGDVTFPTGSPAIGIRFQPGDTFEVSGELGSPNNNGIFTVISTTVAGNPAVSTINVAETITPTLPLGQVRYATPIGAGSPLYSKVTSLEIPGRGVLNYGEYQTTNMLHMLENFSSTTPPNDPTEGQEWYDSANQTLNVWREVGSPQWMALISQEDAGGQFVDIIGDTMTGTLTISGASSNLIVDGTSRFNSPVGINTVPPSGSPVWLEVTGDIQANSQFRGSDQSETAPTYTFTGGLDTGMYRAGTGDLSFAVGGSNKFSIDATGALRVPGSPSYEALLVDSNTIPNKKYIDDIVTALGSPILHRVVEDLTPQLGGNLDVNTFDIIGKPAATVTSAGGGIDLFPAGGGATSGNGGSLRIWAGDSNGGSTDGGNVEIFSGSAAAVAYSDSGSITIQTGNAHRVKDIRIQGGTGTLDAAGGYGGDIFVIAGGQYNDAGNALSGGSVTVLAGYSNGFAGDVKLQGGAGNSGGIDGTVRVLGPDTGIGGEIRFHETTLATSKSVNVKAPDGITGFGSPLEGPTWTLPEDDPATAAGQFLTTDASGILSFSTPVASVAGLDTQIQFNDGGTLGASAGLTFTKGTATLSLGIGSPALASVITTPDTTVGQGNNITITTGVGPSGANSGDIDLVPGVTSTTGSNPGTIRLVGAYNSSSGTGGGITLIGGDSNTGAGGSVYVYGGDSNNGTNDAGGQVKIVGGAPGSSGAGGNITIMAADAATSGLGGDIKLRPGKSTTASSAGGVNIESYDPGVLGGEIRIMEKGNFRYIGLKSPDTVATTRSWELPQDNPSTAAGRALTTDGSGVQSFTYLPGFERQAVGVGSPLVLPGSPPTAPTVYTVANINWTVLAGSPPPNQQSVQVFVDGVKQLVDIDYNVTDSTTITFIGGNEPAAAASHVEFISFG